MPLRAVCWCAEGTTKANNPLVLPLGMVFTYIIPFFMVKLFLMQNSTLPSSESEFSPMHVQSKASLFWRGTSFLVLIHVWQVANSTSSPCASGQLVMCMGANLRVWACDSSLRWSCSTCKGWLMRTFPFLLCQSLLLPGVIVQYPCYVWLVLSSACQHQHCLILSDIPM